MSIKLYNKSKGVTAVCERDNWVECRDHKPSKGWVIYTPDVENDPKRSEYLAKINDALDTEFEANTVTAADYASVVDDTARTVEVLTDVIELSEYNQRAAELRKKNVAEIRTLGIGSNFKVIDPKDGVKGDDSIWFGTCDKCGEPVSNNESLGLWEHRTKTLDAEGEYKVTYKLQCGEYTDK
jgi:hypothetical protein